MITALLEGSFDLKLDYSLDTLAERKALVDKILREEGDIPKQQLGYIADYLLFTADSKRTGEEKREDYPIVTKNRDVTVSKRQVSLEGTVANLANGEDGIYSIMIEDKDALLDAKDGITREDMENIPGVRENLEVICNLKRQFERAEGKRRYLLKQQIISKYRELYVLKDSYIGNVSRSCVNSQLKNMAHMPLDEDITIGEDGTPRSDGPVSLLREDHVAFLLKYYSKLKQESWDDLNSDMHFLLLDLEDLADRALRGTPLLYDLLVWEIDGLTGQEIVRRMADRHGVVHSEQYFSTVWSRRIPKLIAEQAQKDYLVWYYTYRAPGDGRWKICKTCGRRQLAHPLFFHKNTSKDGYYSKCRSCRSKKGK